MSLVRTISELTPVAVLDPAALFEIEQSGESFSSSGNEILALLGINNVGGGVQVAKDFTANDFIFRTFIDSSSIDVTQNTDTISLQVAADAINTAELADNSVTDDKIASQTSTKITITDKSQLNGLIVYTDQLNTYTPGLKQTFAHNTTIAGFRIDPETGLPSAPTNGDIVYQSGTGFQFRQEGSWIPFGGSQSPWLTDVDASTMNLYNLGNIVFTNNATPTITDQTITGVGGTGIILNIPDAEAVIFNVEGGNEYIFDKDKLDIQDNELQNALDVQTKQVSFIEVSSIPSGSTEYINFNSIVNGMLLNVETNKTINLSVNNVTMFRVDGTTGATAIDQITCLSFNSSADFHLEANYNFPIDGQQIGELDYFCNDSLGAIREYADVEVFIQNPLSSNLSAEMLIHVFINNDKVRAITINETGNSLIKFGLGVDFDSNNLTNAGTLNTHTIPGASADTFALLEATQILQNKDIDATNNDITNIGASEVVSGIITGQTEKVSAVGADQVLISDSEDSGNLKRTSVAQFLADVAGITSINNSTIAAQTIEGVTNQISVNTVVGTGVTTIDVGSNVVLTSKTNTYEDFIQTFTDNSITIQSPDTLTPITLVNSQQTLARNLVIPILTGNRTIVVTGESSQITIGTEVTGASTALTDTEFITYLNTANSYFFGALQTFAHNNVDGGFRLFPASGDVTTNPLNGEIWYNSSTNKFRARENGATIDLIGGGGTGTVDTVGDGTTTVSNPTTITFSNTSGGVNFAVADNSPIATVTASVDSGYAGGNSIATVGTITNGTWTGDTIAVANGGTGATTLIDGGILLGSGTGAITATAVLGDGEILIGDGTTDPVTLDVGSSTAITLLGTVTAGVWNGTDIAVPDGGTGVGTLTLRGILFGNGTSAIGATTIGSVGQVLTSGGTGVDPSFQAATGATVTTQVSLKGSDQVLNSPASDVTLTDLTITLPTRTGGFASITLFLLIDPSANNSTAVFEILDDGTSIAERLINIGDTSETNSPTTFTFNLPLDGSVITVTGTTVGDNFTVKGGGTNDQDSSSISSFEVSP